MRLNPLHGPITRMVELERLHIQGRALGLTENDLIGLEAAAREEVREYPHEECRNPWYVPTVASALESRLDTCRMGFFKDIGIPDDTRETVELVRLRRMVLGVLTATVRLIERVLPKPKGGAA